MAFERLARKKRFLSMRGQNHAVSLRAKMETCRPVLNGNDFRYSFIMNRSILIEFPYLINRFPNHSLDHEKYIIEHAHLRAIMNVSESLLVMPSTLTSSFLLPMNTNEFTFEEIIDEDDVYANLIKPCSPEVGHTDMLIHLFFFSIAGAKYASGPNMIWNCLNLNRIC